LPLFWRLWHRADPARSDTNVFQARHRTIADSFASRSEQGLCGYRTGLPRYPAGKRNAIDMTPKSRNPKGRVSIRFSSVFVSQSNISSPTTRKGLASSIIVFITSGVVGLPPG